MTVGKSCLITNYLESKFDDEYGPTVLDVHRGTKVAAGKELDVYRGTKVAAGKELNLEIHDTSGDDDLGVTWKNKYGGADVFAICVAADSITSLDSVEKWKAEIQTLEADKPIEVVIPKRDLFSDAADAVTFASERELQQKKKEHNFALWRSTSFREWTDFNVQKAF